MIAVVVGSARGARDQQGPQGRDHGFDDGELVAEALDYAVPLHPGGPEAEQVPPRVRYPEHGDRGEHVNARLDRGQRVVHAARDGQDAGADDGAVNGAD